MKMRVIWIVGIAAMLLMLPLVTGCGDGEDTAAEAESAAADQPAAAAADHPTEHPTTEATETVAAHDCAGGCGMKAVPEADMTEVNGKWYCAGCAKKAAEG